MPFFDFFDIYGRTFRLFYWRDSILEALRYGGPLPYPHRCSSVCYESSWGAWPRIKSGSNLAADRRANHLKTPFSKGGLVSIWILVFLYHRP